MSDKTRTTEEWREYIESPKTSDDIWGPVGDKPDCEAKCAHCGFKRLRFQNAQNDAWCRRCRYENFDLYFGEGGVNDQKIAKTEKEKT